MYNFYFPIIAFFFLSQFVLGANLIALEKTDENDYKIVVERTGKNSGTLEFLIKKDGKWKREFSTKCWWKASNEIPAKTFTKCSTTKMATKKYKAVYLPDSQTGKKGIFIHQGSKPEHSDGCIVIAKRKIEKIYDTIPRNRQQITVVVKNNR